MIAAAGILLASCKKERTCTCTTTYTSGGIITVGTPSTTKYKKIRKRDAKKLCVSSKFEDIDLTPNPGTYIAESKCELN